MAVLGTTETNAAAIQVISSMVQTELRERAVLVPLLTNFSNLVVPGSNKVEIPKLTSLTAEDKAENTALTSQVLTATTDTLNLDKYKANLVEMERIADWQSAVNMEEEIFKRMASSIVDAMEAEANTVLQATSSSAPDHRVEYASGSTLALADILNARKLLRLQNAWFDDNQMFMAIHPNQEEDLLAIDNLISAEKYASAMAIQNGELGRIYGLRVVVSNNVTADTSLVFHRSHAGYAMQRDVAFDKDKKLSNIADEYLSYALAGFVTLDSGIRGVRIEDAV